MLMALIKLALSGDALGMPRYLGFAATRELSYESSAISLAESRLRSVEAHRILEASPTFHDATGDDRKQPPRQAMYDRVGAFSNTATALSRQ